MRIIVLVVSLLCASSAQALQGPEPEAQEALERQVLDVNGVEGIWFPLDAAKRLLGDVSAANKYKERVQILEERLTLDQEIEAKLNTLKELAESSEAVLANALDYEKERNDLLKDKLDAWHRSPALWFGAGVVVTVVAVVVTAIAVR
jgi:hypothetical protein